ncbi:helix-turn-helix transcriptional regulator [Micromonospora sp. DT48]|uniref:helix-turn-helix transcriptional regulator n=1 Tax=unclassified Micromonospora TaxID=2617518 RepID=UPI0012BC31B5|nr:helix-turn-helix domain-containing protein [Micromonospora sp. CP22]MTK04804.1 winged helix-turn-helix transcriptional regulator [Micromonospora sp. CP22]
METQRRGPRGETIDAPRHRALGSASRVTILHLVRDAEGGVTAAEVAARTGQHLSTTRAHLDRLTEAGLLVKARASGGLPGRPAWRYRAAAADPVPGTYRDLAAALLGHLSRGDGDIRATAARVGQDWGRQLAAATPRDEDPVNTVLAVLDGLGFSPRRQPTADVGTETELHLLTCPFLDLVGQNPDAMCGLHLGVVRGALQRDGAAEGSVTLEPFGAPAACVVRMTAAAPAAGRPR